MKPVFILINLVLLTLGAYLIVQILYSGVDVHRRQGIEGRSPSIENPAQAASSFQKTAVASQYQDIAKRNIFNVKVNPGKVKNDESPEPVAEDKPVEELAVTRLALKLWGTVTGGTQVFAVIEDTKKREQALYQKGDVVQQAVVKNILVHRVVLTLNGQDQVLEMDAMPASETKIEKKKSQVNSEDITIDRALIDKSLEDINGVMKKVRIKPHYTDGKPDGLLIYGIRPGSVFKEMGLKNGDIVREVNGTPTIVEEDAVKIYEDLEDASTARVVISRRGTRKELIYHVKYGARSITTFPE